MADFQTDQKGTSVCLGRDVKGRLTSPNPTRTTCEVNSYSEFIYFGLESVKLLIQL